VDYENNKKLKNGINGKNGIKLISKIWYNHYKYLLDYICHNLFEVLKY